jgi:hypothetical protein
MVRFGDGYDYKTGEQLGYPQEWLDSIGAEVDPKRESGLWTLGATLALFDYSDHTDSTN